MLLDDAAAVDFEVSFQDKFNGFGVDSVLFAQDVLGEGGFGVIVGDGDDGLQNDGAGVKIFVDEMNRAAGKFYAVFEGLALGFEAGKRRQQRRMDIQDAIWEGLLRNRARASACIRRGKRDRLGAR